MNVNKAVFVLSSVVFFACSKRPEPMSVKSNPKAAESAQATPTDVIKEEAAKRLYLDDMTESADETIPSNTAVDTSVEDDKKAARLESMAKKLIAALDADASASLSEDEFLSLLDKKKVSEKRKAKIAAKLSVEFEKFAGEEGQLDEASLIELLKAQGDRIGKFRTKNHRGQQNARVDATVDEILAQFDQNGDGVLDRDELAVLLAELLGQGSAGNGGANNDSAEDDGAVNNGGKGNDDGVIVIGDGEDEGTVNNGGNGNDEGEDDGAGNNGGRDGDDDGAGNNGGKGGNDNGRGDDEGSENGDDPSQNGDDPSQSDCPKKN